MLMTSKGDIARLAAVAFLAAALACGSDPPTTPTPTPPPPTPPPAQTAYLVGAGDIADCGFPFVTATAKQLDSISGTVFTLGDNVYQSGSAEAFANCYAPTWGRQLARTRPVPGNHDYDVAGAQPYFQYFGAAAGSPGLGYYSFEAGNWLVLALNSNVPIGAGSAQYAWVQDELASSTALCTLVLMHHPLFSSSMHGPQAFVRDVWRVLYRYDVELVLTGHDHVYERFAPQDPDGRSDPTHGIRLIIAGTGGSPNYDFKGFQPNSVVQASVHGVLRLVLQPTSYSWQFLPIPGDSFSDSGTGVCR
jgi:acid phosphatase type 7